MTTNSTLLAKADLALADLTANGGELQPEEGASFVRKLLIQPTLLARVRTVEMNASKRKINKIGFGSRILRKATTGVALTAAQRSKPTTEQIELSTKEQIAEVRLPYDVLEDNIERATAANNENSNSGPGGLRDTLITLIAERAALDLEELAIRGDTAYVNAGDPDDQAYLSQLDGFVKQAGDSGNVVDFGGAVIDRSLFKQGVKAMPDQYLRNKGSLGHMISMDNETEYRDARATRETGLGDQTVQGDNAMRVFGSPIVPVSLMPEDKGIFCDPRNLIFGIQRQVSMEYDKDITSRVYIIVLTTRIDFKIEETDATVQYTNIGS